MGQHFFFPRDAYQGAPAGMTVSKKPTLPNGDFRITEYTWRYKHGKVTLWFVDKDRFTAADRDAAFRSASIGFNSLTHSR